MVEYSGEMQHLHKILNLETSDVVQVEVSSPAHIYLMDEANYGLYRGEGEFEYYGDTVRRSPYQIRPPHAGIWHLVIEQVDHSTPLSAGVHIISD